MRQLFENFSTIISDLGGELGLTISSVSVFGSKDRDTRQLSEFLKATVDDVLTRFPWKNDIGTNPFVIDQNGTFKYVVESDSDKFIIDSRILKYGTKWRYLHAKGLSYEEDFRSYENRLAAFAADRNTGRDLNLNA